VGLHRVVLFLFRSSDVKFYSFFFFFLFALSFVQRIVVVVCVLDQHQAIWQLQRFSTFVGRFPSLPPSLPPSFLSKVRSPPPSLLPVGPSAWGVLLPLLSPLLPLLQRQLSLARLPS